MVWLPAELQDCKSRPAIAEECQLALVWTCRLLHIAVRSHTGTTPCLVIAHDRITIRMRSGLEGLLSSLHVLLLAHPCDNARLLQCLAVGERQMPRQLALVFAVHRAEIDGGDLFVILV